MLSKAKSVTYSELVILRNNSKLVAGQQYRITNYTTTTAQANTHSAGHVFDVIVRADSTNKLNENAYAAYHSGDTYFTNSKLESWELKYCLDNDTDRFYWAKNDSSGRGVIYYMKDEWGNECPYDFKNIQFKRKLTNGVLDTSDGTDTWVYTFNAYNVDSDENCDATVICGKDNVAGETDICSNNVIKEYYSVNSSGDDNFLVISLNDIVFLNTFEHSDDDLFTCQYNTFGSDCYSNTFGSGCFSNTFGNGCYSNTFGNYCYRNTFGNNCFNNTFGNGCNRNIFGNDCQSNTFGSSCYSNIFGNDLQSKTINYSKRVVETLGASHAEGDGTVASGQYSHAEGRNTEATTNQSHAEGYSTTASGTSSHAEGNNTVANGVNSHTEGSGTQTTNNAEHAEGIYNKSNFTQNVPAGCTQSSIGIGTSNNARANAVEVMQNGDVYITGIGNYIGTNPNTTGVQTLQGVISDLESLPSPMVFKGTAMITKSGTTYTITVSSPASISDVKEGYTYKITSVPTDDTNFKVGDTLIANIDNPGNSPETNWSLIPSGDDVEDTWRNINVNGSPFLESGISSGALNINDSNNISVTGSNNNLTLDIPQTATPSVTSVEASYTDSDHNLSGYRGMLAKKKVYTNVLGVNNGSSPNNNTFANRGVYFITLYPRDWNSQWTIHYHLNIHLTDEEQTYKSSATATPVQVGQLCRGTYDCILSGTSSVYTVYHMFQSQKNTSYRPFYYHMFHGPNANGNTAGKGYKIGVNFHSSYLPAPTYDWSTGSSVVTNFGRTIEVVIDECINCTAELNDTLEVEADAYRDDYVKLDSSYYTTNTADSNVAGRYSLLSATTQGLYEAGDDNVYTYTQQSANYLKNGTHYDDDTAGNSGGYFLGYNLLGFDKDGKALAISKRTPTATSYDVSVQTTRVYCDVGFDYKKGIRYYYGTGPFAENADMNISTQINSSGLDFRYSDNCVASTGDTNSLGMVNREPVYLRGILGNDGLFYLDPIEVTYNNNTYKRVWVQPGDKDRLSTSPFDTSHVYWFIGYPQYSSSYANSLYLLCLISTGGLSYYDGTELKPYIAGKPVLSNGTAANTIKVKVGNQTSDDYTVPFATTATNLTNNPSIQAGITNTQKITVTAGGKTSNEFEVPYATLSQTFNVTPFSSGDDLNDFKTAGSYGSTVTSINNSLLNHPTSQLYYGETRLDVINTENNRTDYIFQRFWTRGGINFEIFERTYSNNTWGIWRKVLNSGNTYVGTGTNAGKGFIDGTEITKVNTATYIGGNTSTVGSTSLPVYINNGQPATISSLSVSGNIASSGGNLSINGTSALTGKVTTTNDIEVGTDLRVKGNDIYVGTASNAQCHLQYDSTEECINFIFD